MNIDNADFDINFCTGNFFKFLNDDKIYRIIHIIKYINDYVYGGYNFKITTIEFFTGKEIIFEAYNYTQKIRDGFEQLLLRKKGIGSFTFRNLFSFEIRKHAYLINFFEGLGKEISPEIINSNLEPNEEKQSSRGGKKYTRKYKKRNNKSKRKK